MDVYPEADVDEQILGLVLAGPVSVFVLHQLGHPTLHASAVVTPHGALAFLGPRGRGKSSMAACFLRRGAPLLTDDVLPFSVRSDGIYAIPGLPYMKVWPQTVQHSLGLEDRLPNLIPERVDASYDKKLFALDERFSIAESPTALRAFYVLDRYDPNLTGSSDVTIRALGGREGLVALLEHISFGAFLKPPEVARFLPVYARLAAQAPVRIVRFPDGFVHQEAVYASIMADASSVAPGENR